MDALRKGEITFIESQESLGYTNSYCKFDKTIAQLSYKKDLLLFVKIFISKNSNESFFIGKRRL